MMKPRFSAFALILLWATSLFGADWPHWRGSLLDGVGQAKTLPDEWSETKNLLWKTPLKAEGHASPIVHGNRVYIVGCLKASQERALVCLDAHSGKIIWSTNILKVLKKKKQSTKITGFIMGSGKIYATTLNGYLIVCSAVSGNIEYFKKIGDQIIAAPIINNGSLYILTENSRILGFN